MDKATFEALLITAVADVAQADSDAAALLTAQNAITPLTNAAARSAAQAATSTAAAENALAEILQIKPLASPTPPIVPNAPTASIVTTTTTP